MAIKNKPLTEGGNLRSHVPGFNNKKGSIRPSVLAYSRGLEVAFLNKELMEYVSRFKWEGLPPGLNANLIETMLYVKGQLAMFKLANKYYILPFAYSGDINHYGVQTELIPLSYSGTIENKDKDTKEFADAKQAIMYEGMVEEGIDESEIAIILKSHSSTLLNRVIPMVAITDEMRRKLVEKLVMVRNNLILSQPMKYVSVATEAKAKAMQVQIDNMITDILNGNIIQTVVGDMVMSNINSEASKLSQQDMWSSFASLDNLRMEIMGILNNGVFEKRERNLTDEVAGKQTVSKLILDDALNMRKEFCKLCKIYFGLDIKVELSDMNTPEHVKEEPDKRDGQFNPEVDK